MNKTTMNSNVYNTDLYHTCARTHTHTHTMTVADTLNPGAKIPSEEEGFQFGFTR